MNLAYNDVGDVGLLALARSPHLSRLTRLDLSGNVLGEEGGRELLRATFARRLKHLFVSVHRLSDDLRRELDERFKVLWME